MGLLDTIGSPLDIATNPYGATDNSQWNLVEGSFKSDAGGIIKFLVNATNATGSSASALASIASRITGNSSQSMNANSQPGPLQKTATGKMTDTGGRRKVKYQYPYRDGHVVADLGRKGETYNVEIVFYGPTYVQLFNNFVDVCVNQGASGMLSHPVRGNKRGAFEDYEFIHQHDWWNAVAIRAVFTEDSTQALTGLNGPNIAQNSALRQALNALGVAQSAISGAIVTLGQLQKLPSALVATYTNAINGITTSTSTLLGQLASTFSTDSQLQALAAQASTSNIPVTSLSSGTSTAGTLPAVYQVGLNPSEAAIIQAQTNSFINSNQITPAQAVASANTIRAAISTAVQNLQANAGNDAYAAVIQYRTLAVSLQDAVEACIASAQNTVYQFSLPYGMSLRTVAFVCGLSPDRMVDILALNPNLDSANYVPANTVLSVPTS